MCFPEKPPRTRYFATVNPREAQAHGHVNREAADQHPPPQSNEGSVLLCHLTLRAASKLAKLLSVKLYRPMCGWWCCILEMQYSTGVVFLKLNTFRHKLKRVSFFPESIVALLQDACLVHQKEHAQQPQRREAQHKPGAEGGLSLGNGGRGQVPCRVQAPCGRGGYDGQRKHNGQRHPGKAGYYFQVRRWCRAGRGRHGRNGL
mmetsp:Transcript_35023/g.105788  ORF Transcript_35023/g.105788 Transcript_35023/m.105788 type:complete len:203 (+) Transcript_35023:1093-1701(+)